MDIKSARELLNRHGQPQLLDYYDGLSEEQRAQLLGAIDGIDFSVLENIAAAKKTVYNLSPADVLSLEHIKEHSEEYSRIGIDAIKQGKVAAVLLAGGQGTRLGINAPKGTFNIGVYKTLSIFECQINNLLQVVKKAGVYPHMFVMTSTINHKQTVDFFKENAYFGYQADKIHFYVQKTAPAISEDGKILLEEKYMPVLTPNGNGGWYFSLRTSECGKILKESGIEWLNVYGVDNVLQKICDPVFIGATLKKGAACAGKVVKKTSPEEKVGVLCRDGNIPAVVEYYEMPEYDKTALAEDGQLKYRYGVTLNYLFKVSELDKVRPEQLPYHLAEKQIEHIEGGEKVKSRGLKLETLAVDIIKLMGDCLGVEVEREKEFAPVKNATGTDSVDTARALLVKNGIDL
ncbi:MAG: UTP--glucose-1-phosphate uridylyltransferase [Clostridia bacterium]|nr:UTP--glucose-1-phosphate uridylyltransferase [Clostridia bacterium]